jgi:hypothetical protein
MLGREYAGDTNHGQPVGQPSDGWWNVSQPGFMVPVDHHDSQISITDHPQFPHGSYYGPLGNSIPQHNLSGTGQFLLQQQQLHPSNTEQLYQSSGGQRGYRPPDSQVAGDQNQGSFGPGLLSFYEEDYGPDGNIDWSRYQDE